MTVLHGSRQFVYDCDVSEVYLQDKRRIAAILTLFNAVITALPYPTIWWFGTQVLDG